MLATTPAFEGERSARLLFWKRHHPQLSMKYTRFLLIAILFSTLPSTHAATVSSPPGESLTILSLSPSTDTAAAASDAAKSPPVEVSGHEAITLTFSRAVIPLGSDFGPGELPDALNPFSISPPVACKLRWVTTSIARFDPHVDWPPDLELTLTINPALHAFDGRAFAGPRSRWSFTTPHLSMSASRVHSASAYALTNGTWSSSLHPIAPGALECPPDAAVELRFNADVDLEMLEPALRLRRKHEQGVLDSLGLHSRGSDDLRNAKISLSACRYPSKRCALARFPSTPFDVGALYELFLPIGSTFHPLAAAYTRSRPSL